MGNQYSGLEGERILYTEDGGRNICRFSYIQDIYRKEKWHIKRKGVSKTDDPKKGGKA